ncbi:hypothetical protein ACHHYP_14347 [Achlya hypogyna]|uniref:Transmembrane protein n=1 Tax=Achlya hypogyna TaxID=1202772 RepID=A0A1V9YDE0_ACHHY|nr:hypothetical protein ACHHYP_14347 [Achlya hypogyna]
MSFGENDVPRRESLVLLSDLPEDQMPSRTCSNAPLHVEIAVAAERELTSQQRARGTSYLFNDPLVSDDDANELLLRANRVPDDSCLSFDELMKNIKERNYFQQQFAAIQGQAGMNPHTLMFSPRYEAAYADYIQRDSLGRIRFCFLLGAVALSLYVWWDAQQPSYKATATMPFWELSLGNVTRKDMLDVLSITGPASFLVSLGLTSMPCLVSRFRLERLTFLTFAVVALTLVLRKPVGRYKGPVLPLVILLIPIFGITRMRFRLSCILGWGICVVYVVIQMIAKHQLDAATSRAWDSQSDIMYQTVNYAMSIIGGMVSHYRQELLRRRNFALKLPFTGLTDDDCKPMSMDNFRKRSLMHRGTLRFKCPEVEDLFYRHWYLIDAFPFENPNAAALHVGVSRVLRFALIGLMCDQVILGIQDYKLLWLPGHPVSAGSIFTRAESVDAYVGAATARYAVIVPAYLSMAYFMHWLGRVFYTRWLHRDESATAPAVAAAATERSTLHKTDFATVTRWAANVARLRRWTDVKVTEMLAARGGYVQYAQWYSAAVVVAHVGCVAALLVWVTRHTHSAQNVYFMGLLNALLFPHRSTFRIRFVFATTTTTGLTCVLIAIFAHLLAPDAALRVLWMQYAVYMTVVVVLGMLISHEEESLRRTFFILKSLRTLEFRVWFQTVLRVQGWVRAKLKKKLHDIRVRRSDLSEALLHDEPPVVVANAAPYMAMASKLGIMCQSFNFAAVLIDVISSALQY